jgi:membrane associated rhomboid family serine protease
VIPLKNLDPRRSFPIITLLLIAVNVIVFLHQVSLPPKAADAFVHSYGLVPAKISLALAGQRYTLADALIPLFTCMFLHGGWLHILGNMWFLWIFGANVEDRLGPLPYLVFYLVCGLGSGLSEVIFAWGSRVPSIGASGAISGVLGAFIIFFPASRILTLVPLFIIWFTVRIPALVFIGLWFLIQFLSGVESLGLPASANMGGVAWWAHIGGFLLGAILAKVFDPARRPADIYSSY